MKTVYVHLTLFVLFFVLTPFISAQELSEREQLMAEAHAMEYLHPKAAIILVAVETGTFDPVDIPADPATVLRETGFVVPLQIQEQLESASDSTPWTSIGAFSFLITQLYDIPGGVMYGIIPSAHYATKELQHLGIIPPNIHPRQPVSGVFANEALEKIAEMFTNGDIR